MIIHVLIKSGRLVEQSLKVQTFQSLKIFFDIFRFLMSNHVSLMSNQFL